MDRLLHDDPDVAARLRSWGVTPDSEEAEAARRLFPNFESMLHYVRVAYLKADTRPCREFFVSFLTDSGNGTVGNGRSTMFLNGAQGLYLAHELRVEAREMTLFARFAQAWNINARDRNSFDASRQGQTDVTVEAWPLIFQRLGADAAENLYIRGRNLFSTRVLYGVDRLISAGLTTGDIYTYEICFREEDRRNGDFSVSDVIAMHNAGVPAEYATEFTRWASNSGVTAADIISFWSAGIPTEYTICGLRAGHPADNVAQMYQDGIPLDYVTSMGESR